MTIGNQIIFFEFDFEDSSGNSCFEAKPRAPGDFNYIVYLISLQRKERPAK